MHQSKSSQSGSTCKAYLSATTRNAVNQAALHRQRASSAHFIQEQSPLAGFAKQSNNSKASQDLAELPEHNRIQQQS
jgi:hypothetical protein